MKRKFLSIIKSLGFEISEYKTYRSDMGFQVFQVSVNIGKERCYCFGDSYPIGRAKIDAIKILQQFEYELKKTHHQ